MTARRAPTGATGTLRASDVAVSGLRGVGSLSQATIAALKPSRRKYGNVPTVVNGQRFDSKKEAERYTELYKKQMTGAISDLEAHPRFPLVVHGQDCGVYEADFAYIDADGERVVEDVKSAATRKLPTYRLKSRLVWALYGLRVREV